VSEWLFVDTWQGTLVRAGAPTSPLSGAQSPNYSFNANGGGTLSPGSAHSLSFVASESTVANSPFVATHNALQVIQRPRSLTEKARLNAGFVCLCQSTHHSACVRLRHTVAKRTLLSHDDVTHYGCTIAFIFLGTSVFL